MEAKLKSCVPVNMKNSVPSPYPGLGFQDFLQGRALCIPLWECPLQRPFDQGGAAMVNEAHLCCWGPRAGVSPQVAQEKFRHSGTKASCDSSLCLFPSPSQDPRQPYPPRGY